MGQIRRPLWSEIFLRQVGVSDTFRWTVSDCSDCSDQQTYQTSSIRFQDVITWPTEPSEVLKLARSDHLLTEPQEGWRHGGTSSLSICDFFHLMKRLVHCPS